jgi:hypothetical protein
MSETIPPDVARQIAECLYAGRKIEAIKIYREQSGKGLKDAKDFVEALEAQLRLKEPGRFTAAPGGKGCLGSATLFVFGALAAAAAAVSMLRT